MRRCLTLCSVPIDQTTIKTLYIFVEIAIDSSHLLQSIRLNFPSDRQRFRESLLDEEEESVKIPVGRPLTRGGHLRIEGPDSTDESSSAEQPSHSQPGPSSSSEPTRLALVSTIQFVAALSRLKDDLSVEHNDPNDPVTPAGLITESNGLHDEVLQTLGRPRLWTGRYDVTIPRSKPLSPGEILGCTAPQLSDVDALLYVASATLVQCH